MVDEVKVRHCIVQKKINYNRPRINEGQRGFRPGDSIFVDIKDYRRLKRHKKVIAAEETFEMIPVCEIDFVDAFPKISPKIWVFGDGPTGPAAKKLIKPNDVVFAVNHCFWAPLELTPDYYVALDDGMMLKETEKIKELKAIRKFTNITNSKSGKWLWPELHFFEVIGETGFSDIPLEVYHGKTSCYVALQLALQCGHEFIGHGLEIHFAGLDLAVLEKKDQSGKMKKLTHHYGSSVYQEELFPRMLSSIRYGLSHLNELGVRWVNHSPLLAGRIEDLRLQKIGKGFCKEDFQNQGRILQDERD